MPILVRSPARERTPAIALQNREKTPALKCSQVSFFGGIQRIYRPRGVRELPAVFGFLTGVRMIGPQEAHGG